MDIETIYRIKISAIAGVGAATRVRKIGILKPLDSKDFQKISRAGKISWPGKPAVMILLSSLYKIMLMLAFKIFCVLKF
jgi:hypothetical protein